MDKKYQKLNIILFALYCAVMFWLLFDRTAGTEGMTYWEHVRRHLNLEPFYTIRRFLKVLGNRDQYIIAIVNLVGNVVMFIPLGYFLPRIFPALAKLKRTLLATALIITTVELIQVFTLLGWCDIDDLILNLLGAAMGYAIHKIIK